MFQSSWTTPPSQNAAVLDGLRQTWFVMPRNAIQNQIVTSDIIREEDSMQSRRLFMGATAALSAVSLAGRSATAGAATLDREQILSLFQGLPGQKAIKIWAPATNDKPQIHIASNASAQL